MIAGPAVSVRRMRGPAPTTVHPRSRAASTSCRESPPSGPTSRCTRASLPRDRRRPFPEAEPQVGRLLEREEIGERVGRIDRGNDGAAALLRGLLRHPLPAPRALPPAGGLERDDRALREDGNDARRAELGGRADDRLHLVALRDRLDEREAERRLDVPCRNAEDGARRDLADRLDAHGVVAARAVGGDHGVARPEAQHAREVARLLAVEGDVPAGDPVRRDREAAHARARLAPAGSGGSSSLRPRPTRAA